MNENISIQNYQSTTTYLYTKCEVLVRDAIFSPWDRLETLVIMVKRSLMFRQNQIVIHQNPRTQCFFLSHKKDKVYSSNASICQLKILIKVFIVCEPNC